MIQFNIQLGDKPERVIIVPPAEVTTGESARMCLVNI